MGKSRVRSASQNQDGPSQGTDLSPVTDQSAGNSAAQDQLRGAQGGEHLIVAGDTLWGLAVRYYGQGRLWHLIRDANPDRVHRGGNLIYVGDRLIIPPHQAPGAEQSGSSEQSTTPDQSSTPEQSSSSDQSSSPPSSASAEAMICIDFSLMSLAELASFMEEVASGARVLDPVNRDGLLQHIRGLNNDDFAELTRSLDSGGTLFDFLRETHTGDTEVEVEGATIDTEVPVVCWRLWNADDRIDQDVERANEIYNHDGIGIIPVSQRTISKGEAEAAVGTTLDDDYNADASTTSNASDNTFTDDTFETLLESFIPTSVIGGLWVRSFTRTTLFGIAGADFFFQDNYPKVAAISSATARDDTFAHEIGHILTDAGHRDTDSTGTDDPDALMHRGSGRNTDNHEDGRLTDDEVTAIKSSVYGWVVDQCRE